MQNDPKEGERKGKNKSFLFELIPQSRELINFLESVLLDRRSLRRSDVRGREMKLPFLPYLNKVYGLLILLHTLIFHFDEPLKTENGHHSGQKVSYPVGKSS